MLPVVWSLDALIDLEEIIDYIDQVNERAAAKMRRLIEDSAERISSHPFMHRPGRKSGTREAFIHPNYIIVYQVTAEAVDVLAVLHARQRYP